MEPFLPLQLPRIIWLMPRLHVVGSRHKPLSIDPLCFPHSYPYLGVAIILISMLVGAGGQDVGSMVEDHSHFDSKWHTRRHVVVPPPSISG